MNGVATVAILVAAMLGGPAGAAETAEVLQRAPAPATVAEAAAMAWMDTVSLPAEMVPTTRYLWVAGGNERTTQAITMALNAAVSRTSVGFAPVSVAQHRLLRVDLRLLAPDPADLAVIVRVWDSLAETEPYGYLSTRELRDVEPFTHTDGKRYTQRWVRVSRPRVPQLGVLGELIRTTAPVLEGRWWLTKVLTTLDGGVYYDLLGLEAGVTTQTNYLRSRGADPEVIERLRSDQRGAILRSGVSGKARLVSLFQGSGVQPAKGSGLISVTDDPFDADELDPVRDPIRSLLEFRGRGREVIAERANGFHEFTLFDERGTLVEVAPPNLVRDSEIPAPFTDQLQPAISCIRCHAPDEGWRPAPNHVLAMARSGVDVFDDLSRGGADVGRTLLEIQERFGGEFDEAFRLGRNSYDAAVFAVCGVGVKEAATAVADVFGAYSYELVTPAAACRELGVVPADDAAFAALVPPLPTGASGAAPEDPYVATLRAGIAIPRRQWEVIFADVDVRAVRPRPDLRRE